MEIFSENGNLKFVVGDIVEYFPKNSVRISANTANDTVKFLSTNDNRELFTVEYTNVTNIIASDIDDFINQMLDIVYVPVTLGQRWVKISGTFDDFDDADLSETVVKLVLTSNKIIRSSIVHLASAFAGPGLASGTLQVTIEGGGAADLGTIANIVTPVVVRDYSIDDIDTVASEKDIQVTLTTVGANISTLTAGTYNIYLLIDDLP